jgi:hypothetical protein
MTSYEALKALPQDSSRRLTNNLPCTSHVTPATLVQRQSMSNLGMRSTRWTSTAKLNTTFSTNYQMAADLFCIGGNVPDV